MQLQEEASLSLWFFWWLQTIIMKSSPVRVFTARRLEWDTEMSWELYHLLKNPSLLNSPNHINYFLQWSPYHSQSKCYKTNLQEFRGSTPVINNTHFILIIFLSGTVRATNKVYFILFAFCCCCDLFRSLSHTHLCLLLALWSFLADSRPYC